MTLRGRSPHARSASSVCRRQTLAEAEFTSAEHFNPNGTPTPSRRALGASAMESAWPSSRGWNLKIWRGCWSDLFRLQRRGALFSLAISCDCSLPNAASKQEGGALAAPPFLLFSYSSSLRTARNASVGSCTEPRLRIFFLPAPQSLRLPGDPSLILHARGK